MSVIRGAHPLSREMCNALGLDPNYIYSLKLSFAPGDLARAEVGMYLSGDDFVEFGKLLR